LAEELLPMSRKLVGALIAARKSEDRDTHQRFEQIFQEYLEECETRGTQPSRWWTDFLRGLANGEKIIELFDKLKIIPYKMGILNVTQRLNLIGCPNEFLEELKKETEQELETTEPVFTKVI